jgi:hypothetical protein
VLPAAVLHVHTDRASLAAGTGSAVVEGIGPITLQQAREWLGHRRVTIAPVLDPLAVPATPAYPFTGRLREALHQLNTRDVFPWAVNTGRGKDVDHAQPYQWHDTGPPQTGIHNAAPMTRFHHRLKTFANWRISVLEPGTHLWRSPHGYTWLVDPTGTRPLPPAAADLIERALRNRDTNQAA